MADAASLFLLDKVIEDAVLRVEIGVDVHLADVVEQIKVEIGNAALFELFFKDGLHLVHVGKVVARKFGGQEIAFARIAGKRLTHGDFRVATVIAPGGIIVIHAMLHGVVHHFLRRLLIDFRVVAVQNGQAHRAHAERRQLQILKIPVNHVCTSCLAPARTCVVLPPYVQYTRGGRKLQMLIFHKRP